ncbi:uncharacterized protein J4E88_002921 [Alternaria novae-zelandiae]|uniref:uncharacterized protein n=1 Tax=Alternaria ethzedia TaxID=181014 RepID=UPI0020C2E3FF|nr:uncharacterized protein J4E87_006585 [Alternaria ethzedia]XP_049257925.1 uncharacterized protein J4E88_002921 [Alternaria novae-zelandiae]KAI4621369.1 hypothetical protein J4E87_006585 [Alternaria ethzedia]KAI4689567.1 hypothetical protein J4E88_002921 [Alternaria novae-zelandiae]
MSTLSGFTWPNHAKTKRSSPSSPILIPDHRPLIIGLAVAGAATSIVVIYTVFFFILKWRKSRAAKQSKDIESEGKIELQDNDPSPYVGDGHQGGDLGDSRSARVSSELLVQYSGVRKENGKLDFVEVDLGEEKSKE